MGCDADRGDFEHDAGCGSDDSVVDCGALVDVGYVGVDGILVALAAASSVVVVDAIASDAFAELVAVEPVVFAVVASLKAEEP